MHAHVSNLRSRKIKERLFAALCLAAILFGIILLFVLLGSILSRGASRIDWSFFTSYPSSNAGRAGIKSALFGTLWVIALTAMIAVPLGIAAAIYLEEFTIRKNRITQFIQINIANLAGVPSIVYGLLGLALFVRFFSMGRSVIAGACTMSLLVLPMIIIVSQEALRAVPSSYREGAYALGATHWKTIRTQVLPPAIPGIMTGIILSLSRAIGETAPLITIGAATYIAFLPASLKDPFTVLPIQIFNWSSRPEKGFEQAAAAAIIVLLVVLIFLNSVAMILRYRQQMKS